MRLLAVCAAAALSLCACGSSGKLTCTDDAACGDGRRCARTVPGESHGVCVANDSLAFRRPVDQALLAAGSVPITVDLTLGSATQPAPPTVDLFVDGQFAQALSLTAKTGRVASYGGVLTLAGGQTVSLEVVAARGTLDEVSAGPVRVTGQLIPPSPNVASASLGCQTPQACMRDEVVAVSATVENGPASVRVWTELAPGTYYPLTNGGSGTSYSGTIPLVAVPFPMFTAGVNATVEALDASGAVVSSMTRGMTVTRLRWAYAAGVAVTSPAVMDDGTLVVGLAKGSSQVVGVKPDGSQAWAATLEAKAGTGGLVTSAPAVGKKAIWVGSDDGRIYGVSTSGTGLVENGICPAPNTSVTVGHLFTPLVYQLPSAKGAVPDEAAYTGGQVGRYYGLVPSASITCANVAYYTAETTMVASPVMSSNGAVFLALSDPSRNLDVAALLSMNNRVPAELDYRNYYVQLSGDVVAMGVDRDGSLLIADQADEFAKLVHGSSNTDWEVGWWTADGAHQYDRDSLVVSSVNEPFIGARAGLVDRLSSEGKLVQGWPISLGTGNTDVTGLALATVDGSGVALYATTSTGDLFALDQSGAVVWSTRSGSTQLLGSDRLDFPTIAPAVPGQNLPTLYAGSADGHLYAVVVDSGLDPASPWPKAHHDLRNTGNAMPVRP